MYSDDILGKVIEQYKEIERKREEDERKREEWERERKKEERRIVNDISGSCGYSRRETNWTDRVKQQGKNQPEQGVSK